MIMDSIRMDPEWNNGEYAAQPRGLAAAIYGLILMGASPLQLQNQAQTRAAADALLETTMRARLAQTDANDMLYQFDASRDYDPARLLFDSK
jgi:homoserine O-acetyltransferase